MEKQGNWFAVVEMCEKHLKEKEILTKETCIFSKTVTVWLKFSVSAGANQPPGFFVWRITTPNGLT